MILPNLHNLAFDFCLVPVDLRISAADFFCFLFLLLNIHSGSILFNIFLSELFLKSCNGIAKRISLISVLFNGFLHFDQILLQLICFCFQFLYLTPSSQQITVISESTTGHRTTRA